MGAEYLLGPVRRERKAGQQFGFVTVRLLGTVVTNGRPFLQGNHSLTSGVKRNGCYVVPNARSVYSFLKRKETVICMGKQNGTVASEQALTYTGHWECIEKRELGFLLLVWLSWETPHVPTPPAPSLASS